MPSGLSQSHQEIAGQFQWELLQLICLGSGGQHVQRPPPRGMGRPIGLQCPCNSFTRQEVRGASDSTNQRIENNALVSSSGITGGARRVVYLVVSYSPVRGSAKDTRLRIHLDRQANMVQTADGSPEEGAPVAGSRRRRRFQLVAGLSPALQVMRPASQQPVGKQHRPLAVPLQSGCIPRLSSCLEGAQGGRSSPWILHPSSTHLW